MQALKDLITMRREVARKPGLESATLLKIVEDRLIQYGFDKSLHLIQSYIDENPDFMNKANLINEAVMSSRVTFLLVNNAELLWAVHNYFPILFAINNLGKSVYRTTMNTLMNRLLDKDDDDRNMDIRQHLCIFSNIFSADGRIGSMASSIDSIFTQTIFTTFDKRIIFSAVTPIQDRGEAIRDVTHKLESIYSAELALAIKQQATLLFIPNSFKIHDSWL